MGEMCIRDSPISANVRLVDGIVGQLAAGEGHCLSLFPIRPIGLGMERVLHVIARRIFLYTVFRPCGFPLDVVVVCGPFLIVLP